jgi:fructose-1-phosphate kinase PfkB-like protein
LELETVTGEKLTKRADMIKACHSLIDLGAENVLLSLGREGAILTDGVNSYFCKSANVAVNSTVGAGDSMVAAASLMTEYGESKSEILRNAVAAGTASITTPGTNLFYRDKFEEIYGKIYVEKA